MPTVKCPYCGTEHSENTCFDECPHCHTPHQPSWARFCNSCGSELTPTAPMPTDKATATKRCPQCHLDGLPEGTAYCSKCGYNFNAPQLTPRMVVTGEDCSVAYIKRETEKRVLLSRKTMSFRASIYPWMTQNALKVEFFNIKKVEFINITPVFNCKFEYCSFENIDLKCFDTRHWDNLIYFMYKCSNIRKLDLSTFDTRNINYLGYVFSGCPKLEEIDISGWDLSKTQPDSCNNFINDCPSLRRIIMRGCNDYTIDLVETALDEAGINNIEIVI